MFAENKTTEFKREYVEGAAQLSLFLGLYKKIHPRDPEISGNPGTRNEFFCIDPKACTQVHLWC